MNSNHRSGAVGAAMNQDLFSYQAPVKQLGTNPSLLARRNGPSTSRAAAASVDTTHLERIVLEAIARHGSAGCIADDVLNEFSGYAYSSITARFSALERKAFITCGPDKRTGRSGRGQRVMRATPTKGPSNED